MKSKKSSLLILFSVICLDLIGFGIVIPILPFYAEAYGASASVLGLILTSFAGMQFLFSPLWGKLSDRIGRKKVLILTMLGAALGLLILGLANSLFLLFVGRIFSGIFSGNISVATAYITDVTTEENRTKGMGMVGAAFGIGFILGPAMGGFLSQYGYSVPIYAAAGMTLLSAVWAWYKLGDSHHHQEKPNTQVRKVLSYPNIRLVCLINFLFVFGMNQLEATFAFFMMDRFEYDAKQVAYVLVLMALIMVLIQGGFIRRLAPRFGEQRLLLVGGALLGLSFFWIPFNHQVGILLIPLCLSSVGRGISQPSLLSIASKYAPETIRGSVMGTFQSSASLARTIGPAIAGFFYDQWIFLPYLLATLVMIFVTILTLSLQRN